MSKKLKIVAFSLLGVLICFASVKAATIVGNNITTMGSIGIGTTTPSEKLDVVGNININTNGTPALFSTYKGINSDGYNIFIGGGGQSSIGEFGATYKGSFNTAYGINSFISNTTGSYNTANGTNALSANISGSFNTANGVGAGLYIASGTANQTSNNSVYEGYLATAGADGNTNEIVIGASAIGNGSNSATLGNSDITKTILRGNIGIGTTTPEVKLHVSGDSSVFGNILSESQNPGLIFSSTNADPENKKWAISSGRLGSGGVLSFSALSDDLITGYSWLQVFSDSSLIGSQMNPFERVEIYPNTHFGSDVSIGISTSTPSSRLSIIGNNSDNSGYSLDVINSNNDNLFNIRNDGNVFIGTTTSSVANKLTISDPSNAHLQLEAPLAGVNIISDNVGDLFIQGAQSAFTSYYRNTDYAWATGMTDNSNNNFSIWFNGTTNPGAKLSITADGNVGIGTTTPQFNLSVNGSILATNSLRVGEGLEFISTNYLNGLDFWTNGNQKMLLDSFGRLGIGTTTPDSILHVYNDNATTTVTVGGVDGASKGSCLKLRDSNGSGWTYCTTLNGLLVCSTTSCE